MADLPGLIEGAVEGHGLGIQFLKHLSRCRLLLHMIDLSDRGQDEEPAAQFRTINRELAKYADSLAIKDRWLVFNKTDLLLAEQVSSRVQEVCQEIEWTGLVFTISSVTRSGTDALCNEVLNYIESSEQTDQQE